MELTVDDVWQIADAGDQELQRPASNNRQGNLELGAEDNDGLSQRACTALAGEQHCRSCRQYNVYTYDNTLTITSKGKGKREFV